MQPSESPSFRAKRLGLGLLIFLGVLFFSFMGTAAFAPGWLAKPIVQGGTVTLWFASAFGLIWTSVLATGLYVYVVNAAEDRR